MENSMSADEPGHESQVFDFLVQQFSFSRWILSLRYLREEYLIRFPGLDAAEQLRRCAKDRAIFTLSKSPYGSVVCCSIVPTIEAEEILRIFYEALLLRLSDAPTSDSCCIDVLSAYMTEAPTKLPDCSLFKFFAKLQDTFVVRKDDVPKVCLHSSMLNKHLTLYLRKCFVAMKAFRKQSAVTLEQVFQHVSSSAPPAIRSYFAGSEAFEKLCTCVQQHNLQFSTTESGAVHLVSHRIPNWLNGLEQAARYFHQILYAFKLCGHDKVCFNILMSCVKVSQDPTRFFLRTEFPSITLIDFFQSMPEYFDTSSTFNCVAPVCKDIPETFEECNNLEISTVEYYVTLLWVTSAELQMEVLQLCLQYADEKIRKYCLNNYPKGIPYFFLQYPNIFKVSRDGDAVKVCLDVPRFSPSDKLQSENDDCVMPAVVSGRCDLIQQVMQGTCSLKKHNLLSVFLRRSNSFMQKENKVVLTNTLRPKLYNQGSSSVSEESSVLELHRNIVINYFVNVLTAQPSGLTVLQLEAVLHKSPQNVQDYFKGKCFKSFFLDNIEGFMALHSGNICARPSELGLSKQDSPKEETDSPQFCQLLKIQKAVKVFDELITKILRPLNDFCAIELIKDVSRRTIEEEFGVIESQYESGLVGFLTTRSHLFQPSRSGRSVKLCKESVCGTLKSGSCLGTVNEISTLYGKFKADEFHGSVSFPSWSFTEPIGSRAHHCNLKVGDTVEVQYLFYTKDNPCVTSDIKVENPSQAKANFEMRDCIVVFAGPYYALLVLKKCDDSTDVDVIVVYANIDSLGDLQVGDSVKVSVRPSFPSTTIWKAYELGTAIVATGQTENTQTASSAIELTETTQPVLSTKEQTKSTQPVLCAKELTKTTQPVSSAKELSKTTQPVSSAKELNKTTQPVSSGKEQTKNTQPASSAKEQTKTTQPVLSAKEPTKTTPPVLSAKEQTKTTQSVLPAKEQTKTKTTQPVLSAKEQTKSTQPASYAKELTKTTQPVSSAKEQTKSTQPVSSPKEVAKCKESAHSKYLYAATAVAPKKLKNAVLHYAIAYFANAIGDTGSVASIVQLEDALQKSPKPIQEYCLKNFPNNFPGFFEKYGHAFSVSKKDKIIRTLPMKLQLDPKRGSVKTEAYRKNGTAVPVQAKGNAKSGSCSAVQVKTQTKSGLQSNSTPSQKSQTVTQKTNIQEVHPVQVQTASTVTKRDTQEMSTVENTDHSKLFEILEVNDTESSHFVTTASNPFNYALLGTLSGLWMQGAEITAKKFPRPIPVFPWAFIQDSGTVSVKMTSAWQLGDTVEFDAVHDPEQHSSFATCVVKVSKPICDVPPKSYVCEVTLVTTYYALLRIVPRGNEIVPVDKTVLLFSDPKGVKLVPFQRTVAEAVPDYPSPELWKVCSLMDYQT